MDMMNSTAVPLFDEESLPPVIFFLMWFNVVLTGGGNLITIIAFLSNQDIRSKPSNIYILNLALADAKVGLISLPFFNLWYHFGTWSFGESICKLWLVIDYTACTQSMIAIILISWDRLWMVSRMSTYLTKQTNRLAIIIISTSWAFWYIFYALVVSFGDRTVEGHVIDFSNDCDMHINYRLDYTLFEIIGLFTIPVLIITSINIKLYVDIRNRMSVSQSEYPQNNRKSTNITLAALVTAYAICWVPYHIVLLLETINEGSVASPIVAFVEYLLWLNSTINPFLYVCTNRLFRHQLRKMFRLKVSKSAAPDTSNAISSEIKRTMIQPE